MLRSRWGVFAANDHRDAEALIPEVLLYDRLVFPYPEPEHRERWQREGWDPDRLDARLDLLGELSVSLPWDAPRKAVFRTALQDIQADIDAMNNEVREQVFYATTRRALAQTTPRESNLVDVVPAYPSCAAFEAEHSLGLDPDGSASFIALKYEFLTPIAGADPEATLRDAIALARDDTFRQHRQEFHHWQAEYLEGRIMLPPADAVEAIREMSTKYNLIVKAAHNKLLTRTAFCISAAALSVTGALASGNLLSLVGAGLGLVAFYALDRGPVVAPGRCGPAAMFHDAAPLLGRRI